jgi:hypothetical protein
MNSKELLVSKSKFEIVNQMKMALPFEGRAILKPDLLFFSMNSDERRYGRPLEILKQTAQPPEKAGQTVIPR